VVCLLLRVYPHPSLVSNCTISTIANYTRGVLPSEPSTDGQFVVCPTSQSILGNCKSFVSLSLFSCKTDRPLQLFNATGILQHHKMEMVAAPVLAPRASVRTHTRPMRKPLMATRMGSPIGSLLHPDLHRYLDSSGSLCLVWLPRLLPSYNRLVPPSLPVTA